MRLTDRDSGFVQDTLIVAEVDELERTLATIQFDADDITGAIEELERRHRLSLPPRVATTMEVLGRLAALFNESDGAGFAELMLTLSTSLALHPGNHLIAKG